MELDDLIIKPCSKLVVKIQEIAPLVKLHAEATLIYENHTPNFAILLLKGRGLLYSKPLGFKKAIEDICLIGFKHMVEKQACGLNVSIKSGAFVSFIDLRDARIIENFRCPDIQVKP